MPNPLMLRPGAIEAPSLRVWMFDHSPQVEIALKKLRGYRRDMGWYVGPGSYSFLEVPEEVARAVAAIVGLDPSALRVSDLDFDTIVDRAHQEPGVLAGLEHLLLPCPALGRRTSGRRSRMGRPALTGAR